MTTLRIARARFVGFGGSAQPISLPAKKQQTLPERFFCEDIQTDLEFHSVLRFEEEEGGARQYNVSVSAATLPFALLSLCMFSLELCGGGGAEDKYALVSRPVFSGYANNATMLAGAAAAAHRPCSVASLLEDETAGFFLFANRAMLCHVDVDLLLLVSRYVRARVLLSLSLHGASWFVAGRFNAALKWLLRMLMHRPPLLFLYGLSSYGGFMRAVADFGGAAAAATTPDLDKTRWKLLRADAVALEEQLDTSHAYFIMMHEGAAALGTALMQHAHAQAGLSADTVLLASQQAAAQWLPAFVTWKCRAREPAPASLDRPAEALASRDILFVELPFPYALCKPLLRGEYASMVQSAGAWLSPGGVVAFSEAGADRLPLIVIESLEWWTPRDLLLVLQPFMRREIEDPLALQSVKLLVFATTTCYADDDGALLLVSRSAPQTHRLSLADNYTSARGTLLNLIALPKTKMELLRWTWRNGNLPLAQRLSYFFGTMLPSPQRPLCLEVLSSHAAQSVACFSSALNRPSVWRACAHTQSRAALLMEGEQLFFARLLALLCFYECVAVVVDDAAPPSR